MKRVSKNRPSFGSGRASTVLALAGALLAAGAWGQVWEVGEQGLVSSAGAQAIEQFGQVLASGDFNNDGFHDLVVGSPLRNGASTTDSGRIQLHWGGVNGLGSAPATWAGGSNDMNFGAAIAAGDFDNDGRDELAVGAPGFAAGGNADAGRLYVFDYVGTSWTTDFWEQSDFSLTDEPGDRFGEVLTVGDFNNDGYEDLVVGMPQEDLGLVDSGAILQILGSASGLTATGSFFMGQASVAAPEQANARFGQSLAAGDFNGDDAYYDLAIGAPYYDISGTADAGIVALLFGGTGGLSTSGYSLASDALLGGTTVAGDNFGRSLATGDFNRTLTCWLALTCRTDLAIGVPGKQVSGAANAGRVWVIYSGSSVAQFNQGNLSGSLPEANDRFGEVLLSEWYDSRLLNGNALSGFADDLVVGVPGENWNGVPYQGVVHLVFGSSTGLNGGDPPQWRIAETGLSAAPPAAFDNFGYALTLGRFNAGGYADVAIGVVGRDTGALDNAGMVQVMYGALYADGFETGGTTHW